MELDLHAHRSLLPYWGKAHAQDGGEPDHPLVFHALDVAACAREYLDRNPRLTTQLAAWLGTTPESARDVLTFLLAVHDIGKFAENFQNKVPESVLRRFGEALPSANSRLHHDAVGLCFLHWLFEKDLLPERMREWDADIWVVLLTASFGHHGTPPDVGPSTPENVALLRTAMFERSRQDALIFFAWCAERFLPDDLPKCDESAARMASWWIAGLAVLTDWIGSNTKWFYYANKERRELSLDEYWYQWALPRARNALSEAGVLHEPFRPYAGPASLLRHLQGIALRPAQVLASEFPIGDSPQILFLEDSTGSGKTEAALVLAGRVIDAGLADGLYFGLPTQATSDQMFERIDLNLAAWFDNPARVSIALAHGGRLQVRAFLAKLDHVSDSIPGELDTASLRVTQWLADSGKRALQAQIGVGTLDQALMAGLRVRHQSLRMLGLFGKVLLVDEVHAYDPYMTQVLCETLRLHAASGGTAILLSATMPLALRSCLLDAYAQGSQFRKPAARTGVRRTSATRPCLQSLAYPLLTRWRPADGPHVDERAFPAGDQCRRTLDIEYLTEEGQVFERIESWLAGSQSVVWIRNTVADASGAWSSLRQRFGDTRVRLFHSRFAGVDRRTIQNEVLGALGKSSDASSRGGRIIISTQVLQESLDIDADQMICDLTLIDEMLQRFGRYRRHPRDAEGNLLIDGIREDGRVPGRVVVFGPDRDAAPDKGWYGRFSRGAAMVYPAHGKLWLSARALGGRIVLPDQYRSLVEAVYGDGEDEVPTALQLADDRDTGERVAQRGAAKANIIPLLEGYRDGNWSTDEHIGTRLGDSINGMLVRVEGAHLVPWAQGRCAADDDAWALSAIRIPGHWLRGSEAHTCTDPHLAMRIEQLKALRPALKYRLILPLAADDHGNWRCTLGNSKPVRLSYCDARGLSISR